MNKEVNFKIAKLLEEKGFNNESSHYYNEEGKYLFDMDFPALQPTKPDKYFDAPTIAEVVMWLYEKHSIWIYIKQGYKWEWYIETVANHPELKYNDGLEDSPTEAYEEAIIYTLENLIQGGNK